jgi:hypothetical protein
MDPQILDLRNNTIKTGKNFIIKILFFLDIKEKKSLGTAKNVSLKEKETIKKEKANSRVKETIKMVKIGDIKNLPIPILEKFKIKMLL